MISQIHELNMPAVLEHYLDRERVHKKIRHFFDKELVSEYVQLALGISDQTGNYSAHEHGWGPRILADSDEIEVFECARAIEHCPDSHHLPETIYRQGITGLKIGVGTEMALMLKPSEYWVGNVRTIWSHLLLKHSGFVESANEELLLYRDNERDSEMEYKLWRDVYLSLEHSMQELTDIALKAASKQSVTPGQLRFLWADAVADELFNQFAAKRPQR